MPDSSQTEVRKAIITEGKAQPPDPMSAPKPSIAPTGAAQLLPNDLPGPGGRVLDTSQEMEPYRTDDAKTAVGAVNLVGGYVETDTQTGEQRLLNVAIMREMNGHDEDMLTNSKIDMSRRFHNVLASCLTRIGDGKGRWITDEKQMSHVVDNLTIGDRSQLLLHLRVISVYPEGETYTFRIQCGNCGAEIRHTVDLSKVKTVPMSNPMKRIYDALLPSGMSVRCRVMLGQHERILDEAQQVGQNILSAAIMARVLEVNGKPISMATVKDMSARDRNFLRQKFDEVEGGVETTTAIRCGSCGARFEGEIDISQRDFFFPSRKSRS